MTLTFKKFCKNCPNYKRIDNSTHKCLGMDNYSYSNGIHSETTIKSMYNYIFLFPTTNNRYIKLPCYERLKVYIELENL